MRVLDLFCCQGGAGTGYHRAGFEVVGVDVSPQSRYPFEFHQADALEFLAEHGKGFDVIHASPPCRDHTNYTGRHGYDGTGWLLTATRIALRHGSVPFVIENVPGAPLRESFMLCGSMFGLGVRRHRIFESNMTIQTPACNHKAQGRIVTVTGHPGGKSTRDGTAGRGSTAEWREAMGIDWMTVAGLAQAVPPAYTEYIGHQLMAQLKAAA